MGTVRSRDPNPSLNRRIFREDRFTAINGNKRYGCSSHMSRQHDGCNKQGSKDHGPGKDKEEPAVRFFLMRLFFLFHGCFTFMILLCR